MASGWANDDAVQQQIDSTIEDAVARARRDIPGGESLTECEECGETIPEARRKARNASRRKIYITRHIQDIIAEDRRIASCADFS